MLRRLIQTGDDVSLSFLRLVLGLVIFPHGAQHLLGWFGGPGPQVTMEIYTATFGIPAIFGVLGIVAEFFGPLGLVVGLLGRVAALGVAGVMVTAALLVHLPFGFFQDWFGNQQGEGIEFFILATAMALVVIVKGSGAWSLDRALANPRAAAAHRHPAPKEVAIRPA
jgi:putative oxidoreductase